MSTGEDEAQALDEGWDDESDAPAAASEEDELDQAWDSLPPPVSGVSVSAPASSMPPITEAVDSGWDDVPEGALPADGKRRRHRPRRAKSAAVVVGSASPVLLPRPAEPTKKQQREHVRKQRAYEAQVKQQRKQERKHERAAEMKREAQARQQQAEAEARARAERQQAREQAQRERAREQAELDRARKAKRRAAKDRSETPRRASVEVAPEPPRQLSPEAPSARKKAFRPGVVIALVILLAVALLLFWRK